jgi:1,2-phenylacetyl-CoA epoxidase catalytic subunit
MLAEEEFHTSLADAWYRRLAAADDEARGLLVAATEAMLPATLAWVGADDDATRAMVEAGVIGPAAERLSRYRARVAPLLAVAGINVESADGVSDWDPDRGRTTGRPDEDAVERVRGDRNRSLFVE